MPNHVYADPNYSKKTLADLKALAERGDVKSQAELAWKYYWGIEEGRNEIKSFFWAKDSEGRKTPKGRYVLARCYLEGFGVAKDEARASKNIRNFVQRIGG